MLPLLAAGAAVTGLLSFAIACGFDGKRPLLEAGSCLIAPLVPIVLIWLPPVAGATDDHGGFRALGHLILAGALLPACAAGAAAGSFLQRRLDR